MIPEQSGSWTLPHVGLLCLLCVIGTICCVGRDAATKVGATGGSVIAGRTDLKIGHSGASAAGCVRPAEGAEVGEPEDLRSVDGVLKVDLAFRSYVGAKGERRYCYVTVNGGVSPTLRAKPGDTVILNFKNEAAAEPEAAGRAARTDAAATVAPHGGMSMSGGAGGTAEDSCANGAMKPASTNLHFHGLTVPAVCHQDDVLHTMIQPGDAAFQYRFQIPQDEPPGLYWYHPHIHGFNQSAGSRRSVGSADRRGNRTGELRTLRDS